MAALAQRDGVVLEKAPRSVASVVCKLLSTCPSTGASQVVVESIGGDMAQFFYLFLLVVYCKSNRTRAFVVKGHVGFRDDQYWFSWLLEGAIPSAIAL